ncbi:MAG: ribosome maturation factor RimP [Eubacteriales bacterium]|jgi:ribosome maturation factor RimP|nr:ribosome maturation factor RimP [Eubacteriales bacterium]
MSKSQKNTAALVSELLDRHINNLGYELWDVEYVKEGSEWYLRITIDKPDGIDINDCETVHRGIEPLLDEADLIVNAYRLEVSSPGIERELRTGHHFEKSIGKDIILKLYTAKNGKKLLHGTLLSNKDGFITITEPDGNNLTIKRTAVSRANIYFDFKADNIRKKPDLSGNNRRKK